ncbi:hypothetical protein NitYY0826_C1756 [Nitratiruptor sp. YY08-26]|uniref:hypothetical protein n=1 Tax=unclassified Nitratiruptor TaxID=2624044 RepID=UPI0019164CBC|nr:MULTISPECIES: hypothetical protein [unclassified Nitratiruptor]BCD62870.1 hypothetical protein NitYY0813_C1754 [Nitratiruptor sp. YY08-13]BCD66806.1 hypothetical protein NitYY0826_C1756 [Nitratiruptor sp. YY08-26]
MTAKEMAAAINVPENTFSRWKHSRPELYQRIVKSFECEEALNKLEITLDEAKEIIEKYKKERKK